MDIKRIAAFLIIVAGTFVTIVLTSPHITKNIKLGLELVGGFEILYEAEPIDPGQALTRQTLREAAYSLERRANVTGVAEPEVIPEGTNRIRVRLAGVENEREVRDMLKKPANLTFRSNTGCSSPTDYCNIELRGDDFSEGGAGVDYDPNTRQPVVTIKLKNPDKFFEVTRRIAQAGSPMNIMAIFMDEEPISEPAVHEGISGGSAIISGNFTSQSAKELAGIINAGALPVKLTEKYTQSVGATLGKLSLQQTVQAGIIGSVIILLFMLVIYRIPGIVSCITLITYTWLILLVFYWMKATLTLPGIAAFVLGIGMAVDANIITYERIKEEIRSGKSISSSLKAGSKNSARTIVDANLTTIIAAIVLYFVGTGAIQGFALTLIFSILVSVLTNVLLSRLLLFLLIKGNVFKKPGYFGVKEADIRAL